MSEVVYRPAWDGDFDNIIKVYEKEFMMEKTINYPNWQEGFYPSRSTIKRSLEEETLYVAEIGDRIVAAASIDTSEPKEYGWVDWIYDSLNSQSIVVHALCVSPEARNLGVAAGFIDFANMIGEDNDYASIRMDVYCDNKPMIALVEKYGMRLAGTCDMTSHGFTLPNQRFYEYPVIRIKETGKVQPADNYYHNIRSLSDFAKEIVKEHFDKVITQEQNDYMIAKFQSADAIHNQIHEDGYDYFEMYWLGKRIGFFATKNFSDGFYISKYYVHKDYRGMKFAKVALKFIKELAYEFSATRLYLRVNINNHDTILAYEAMGFVKNEHKISDIGNGYFMDDYEMSLPL